MLGSATMSGKRRRHSTSSSNEHGRIEPQTEARELESIDPDGKFPRTSDSNPPRYLVCSLPPTCAPPRHPTSLGSLRELEEHYKKYHTHICKEGNCRNEPGGAKIFPDARMLELHQTEYHDELARIKNERGESTVGALSTTYPIIYLPHATPHTGRRLHLIDAHGYPKLFFFAVTKHGVGGLLARYGEGATLIRKPWKPRAENQGAGKEESDSDGDDDTKSSSALHNTVDQPATPLAAEAGPSQTPSVPLSKPREDLDDLASSMKSLSLVPTSIRFGRGARRAGFVRGTTRGTSRVAGGRSSKKEES
ncbi:zinc finger protein, partial [Rhizoctonia solani]